jgi:Predicted metal-dependent hydrolase
MAKNLYQIWEIDGAQVPVYLFVERRRDNRVSITQKGVHIRMPKKLTSSINKEFLSWSRKWVGEQLTKTPKLAANFNVDKYHTGKSIITPHKSYILNLEYSDHVTSKAQLHDDHIMIRISEALNPVERSKITQRLISRILAKDQKDRVTDRINQINDRYFGQDIKEVRLKNNSSNWGSCSSKGNINISTKTLLAPYEVQDYIFVHELAHRIEMNHSPRYWNVVKKVMPDYERHEAWIKKYGHLCQF